MTTRWLVAIADVGGDAQAVRSVVDEERPEVVLLAGDLSAPDRPVQEGLREVLRVLGESRVPAFWVPGPHDAPLEDYLRESYNMEVVFPFLHGVHGTAALAPGYVLVAGMGGRIEDRPDRRREEVGELRYPGWEVEYRLKIVREFREHLTAFVFASHPAHKGLAQGGSEVLAELIKTYRPRVAVAGGGEDFASEMLGRTLVVMPGSLRQGRYARIDLIEQTAKAGKVG